MSASAEALAAPINPSSRPVVAIDIGQEKCHVAYMPPGGKPFISEHPAAETAAAVRAALAEGGGLVVVEHTGGLEVPLLLALEADPALEILIAQHTDSAALRRLLKRPRKTDRLDADLLARLVALSLNPEAAHIVGDHLRPWPQMRSAIVTRPKVRHLERLVSDRARLKLRKQRRPEPEHQAALAELIATYDRMIEAATAALVTQPGPAESLLATLPGVSPRRAAVLAATIGEIDRFPTSDHLVRYVGLRPPLPSISGGKTISRPKIARASVLLAGELHMWALGAARFPERHGPMGAAITRYKSQDRTKVGMWTAKRLLIRTAYALLRDGQPYDPEHQPRRGAPAAAAPAG